MLIVTTLTVLKYHMDYPPLVSVWCHKLTGSPPTEGSSTEQTCQKVRCPHENESGHNPEKQKREKKREKNPQDLLRFLSLRLLLLKMVLM